VPTLRIVNASPLILLTKVGRIDLLNAEGVDVVVPTPVPQEVSSLDGERRSDCRRPESGWRVTPRRDLSCGTDFNSSNAALPLNADYRGGVTCLYDT